MVPVIKRYAVFTATLCLSLIIPVMKADKPEYEQTSTMSQDDIETIDMDDANYYNDEHEDIALMADDEFEAQNITDDVLSSYQKRATTESYENRVITSITIAGNTLISNDAIMNYVPFKVGELFEAQKTGLTIRTIYQNIKRFQNVQIFADATHDGVDLQIVVKEKPVIKQLKFTGNNNIAEKEFKKKIDFDVPALDQAELKRYERKLQKMYREKSYHNAEITGRLEVDEHNKATVIFDINEGKKTLVSRICFSGNKHISSKELRGIIYTREDWILSFLDNSGSYLPEKLEADKHVIEQYYQNHGFLKAKVFDAEVIKQEENNSFMLVFHVEEGDCFRIGTVTVDGNDILNEEYLQENLPVKSGDLYSREGITDSIKILEMLWGNLGYIYAHIDPDIQPDEETQTVNVSFGADIGEKVTLNKITIIGNKKTRDRIIRRRLLLDEGCLITHFGMEESKNRVEALGYFEMRDGVNWKLRRIDKEHADLDLIVKEIKTGHANLKLGFGGSATALNNPGSGMSIGLEVNDTNLFGSGLQFNFQSNYSKDEINVFFNLTEPWLFDKPILSSFDLYHRRPSYDELKNTEPVNEILSGGSLTIGFVTPRLYETQILTKIGIDSLMYEKRPLSKISDSSTLINTVNIEYQKVLDKLFEPADFVWLSFMLSQDKRNNPMHPSKGVRWTIGSRFGLPSLDGNVGFHKFDIDFHWWTGLIGDSDLILHFRTYLGVISRLSKHIIPYRELFHIGGPASVRGFLFGQLSPQFIRDSIGGQKAFFVNLELIFPVTADFTTKGVVFYDGGCGWDNPYAQEISREYLRNNNFNYRHSVGIGVRLLKPAPIRIDWGFKLDRKKKLFESPHEVHFSMSYDW